MFKKLFPVLLVGLIAIGLPFEMFGQWNVDTTNKNIYLNDGNYKLLLNNLTYTPGALSYKLDVRGGITASLQVRAPYFQDSDNIGFYVDPTSLSNLWDVTVHNSLKSPSFIDKDNTNFYVDPASTSILNNTRSSIFYDRDNTSFFLDPASSSTLSTLTTNTLTATSVTFANIIRLNPSAALNFSNGLSGGNGEGQFAHNGSGFRMQAAGYGSDSPAPGGYIRLLAGGSEDYEGGDILLDAGDGAARGGDVIIDAGAGNFPTATRHGMIFIDKSNISNVGIGFTTAATLQAKLDVNGSVRATSYITVSDGTLKSNVKPISGALDKILQLKGTTYTFKDQNTSAYRLPASSQIGFIAQEVEQVLPEAVFTDSNGLKGVEYNKVIPVLVEAIKELNVQVKTLKSELADRRITLENQAKEERFKSIELHQNNPNPFDNNTTISYKLVDGISSAGIYIFDMQGKEIKRVNVPVDSRSIEIQSGELGAGMYIYSLIVDGKEVDTKRMILTR